MNWALLYEIVLALFVIFALAWAWDARRTWKRAIRLARLRDFDLPTEEIELPPTMRVGPRLEEFGPGKPLPHYRDAGLNRDFGV